jgi:predicted nucleotidyltransferase
MERDQALAILATHKDELARFHVKSLALFGSVARDEARPESDVDVLVEFDGPGTFDRYMDLKDFLEAILGRPVDVVTKRGVKPRLAPLIARDMLRVA